MDKKNIADWVVPLIVWFAVLGIFVSLLVAIHGTSTSQLAGTIVQTAGFCGDGNPKALAMPASKWREAKQRLIEHLDACPLCEKSANFSV